MSEAAGPLVPLMLLALVGLLTPRAWIGRQGVQRAILIGLAIIVLRYLWWRLTTTVLPADRLDAQSVFVWTLFAVECLAWFDAAILFLALSRRTDRTPEADRHEARLRAADPAELPVVDVLIATCNESVEVLEKTIIGALSLDWPRDKLRVHVLDDGNRDWLRDFCAQLGVDHVTRRGDDHAKAGNINAALLDTCGELILVLDADFVAQRSFLYRSVGFFDDPTVGIVQIPHNFFNDDPMQASLELRRTLPDDQRLFFDAIMPGRDGWDCAFCCGSNGVIRRSAIDAIGGRLPSGSITEDMLLTLALIRKGYRTRYLRERLAIGLAPESLSAFFVQRARWARGAIQILFLRDGPLGPGLRLVDRLMFLPTHWLAQSLMQTAAMATPAIYLLTGLLPLMNANSETVIEYQIPAVIGAMTTVRLFAPGQYFPLAATAHSVLQAFRLMPTILSTLVSPHGHAFKVTPKGKDAAGDGQDAPTAAIAFGLIVATAAGLLLNADYATRIVDAGALIPIVAFWSVVNMIVLVVVMTIAVAPPAARAEERFALSAPCSLRGPGGAAAGRTLDLSVSGAQVAIDGDPPPPGSWVMFGLDGVGPIPAWVVRTASDGGEVTAALRFHLPWSPQRRALIRLLYSEALDNSVHSEDAVAITLGILGRVVKRDPGCPRVEIAPPSPPRWAVAAMRAAEDRARWEADLADELAARTDAA